MQGDCVSGKEFHFLSLAILFGDILFQGDLRVGNHRRILRSGMPDLSQGVGALNAHGMDEGPRVPGCTMYLRLLPASNVGNF